MERIANFQKVSRQQFVADFCAAFPETAEVEQIYEQLRLPERATAGSAGYDFYAPMALVLQPRETVLIPTGVRVKMRQDWVLQLFPRSGLGFRYRLRLDNTVGIIDSDYYGAKNEGHIQIKLTNHSEQVLSIPAGSGFAQGIFLQYGITEDDAADGKRTGGLGSTTAAVSGEQPRGIDGEQSSGGQAASTVNLQISGGSHQARGLEMVQFYPVRTAMDIALLARLANEVWHEFFRTILSEAQIIYMVERFQSIPAITAQLQTQGYTYYLLTIKDGTLPIGYMGIKPEAERMFLSKLYILKPWRGKGYASAAFAFLRARCEEAGLPAVYLTVNKQNTNSIAIYQKKGFVIIDTAVTDIGGGFVMDDYIMEWSL